MPPFVIIKRWKQPQSFRALSVAGSFTLTESTMSKTFEGNIPIECLKWKIGLIVGRSGTGKTSIAKQCFPQDYINSFTYTGETFMDDFPAELKPNEITQALCNVGFASPPDWEKRYDYLSQGEKMRTDIARAILLEQKLIVFDEFTSVVDREIAKISSFAIAKAIRKSDKQFIAVTCHSDVIEWLEPDWIFNTDTMLFTDFTDKKKESDQQLIYKSILVNESFGASSGTIII